MISDIAVIGAGPYGLSISAHLQDRAVPFRIFGKPMDSWIEHMPAGMALKSEGFASDIADPRRHTLERFCRESGLPYESFGFPIPLATFARYGLTFQQRLAGQLDTRQVEQIDLHPKGFSLRLANGEIAIAGRVVMATGLANMQLLPACLAALPREFVSHSGDHGDLRRYRGRKVAVIGGGASATDTAALLHEAGAEVTLVARTRELAWLAHAARRRWWRRLLKPHTGLGFGWKFVVYMAIPGLFRYLPSALQIRINKTALGPSGASHVRPRVVGQVNILLGQSLRFADASGGQVVLHLENKDGARRVVTADHVVAATGYNIDVARMKVLSDRLRARLKTTGRAPKLSSTFESSVPGLYFAGAAAAASFGPLMRFVVGTQFAAPRLARHLARSVSQRPARAPSSRVADLPRPADSPVH
jgi:cation diffusion facilitator CzcD-associated flavoprotein CzcO